MKTLNFEGRNVIAIEHADFNNFSPVEIKIDLLLVPKDRMLGFRETEVFKSLWNSITDNTRIIYC